ncbi:hypothetical protein ACOSQ3_009271 [Xanthoceras sorbifolium]
MSGYLGTSFKFTLQSGYGEPVAENLTANGLDTCSASSTYQDISLQLIVKLDDPDAEPKFLALLTDNKRKWRTNLAAHGAETSPASRFLIALCRQVNLISEDLFDVNWNAYMVTEVPEHDVDAEELFNDPNV